MFFFYDSFDKSVEVFSSLDKMAKFILDKLRVSLELGSDPVQLAKKSLGNRGRVLTVNTAFGFIAEHEDKQARELANKFHDAIRRARAK